MTEIQFIEKCYLPPFISGKDQRVEELVQQDIRSGMTASEVVNRRLIATMEVIGQQFQNGQIFVPEMMIAASGLLEFRKFKTFTKLSYSESLADDSSQIWSISD